jgi:hypothetical protein
METRGQVTVRRIARLARRDGLAMGEHFAGYCWAWDDAAEWTWIDFDGWVSGLLVCRSIEGHEERRRTPVSPRGQAFWRKVYAAHFCQAFDFAILTLNMPPEQGISCQVLTQEERHIALLAPPLSFVEIAVAWKRIIAGRWAAAEARKREYDESETAGE